jgi:Predicted dehydrogenase
MANEVIYDSLIIGGGVIGCSIARYLSRYKGSFILLERHNDVGDETSSANSAIVHSGYDPKPGTLKARFNVEGNKMMEGLTKELDVPYKKIGSITVALNEEDLKTLDELNERAKINGVDAKLLTKEETIAIEPNINKNILASLYCKDAGIVSPFSLTVSLMENAMDNGVYLKLNSEVVEIKKEGTLYRVKDQNGLTYLAKTLINATGVNSEVVTKYLEEPSFHINPTKGEYILLDHFNTQWIKHTLFMCPSKVGKGVLVSPTTSYNYIVGPSATLTKIGDASCDSETYAFLREKAKSLVDNIPYFETIKGFAGVRANNDHDDFIIEESNKNPGFYLVCGIMSPGLASSPAIGKYVSELVKNKLKLNENLKFNPRIRPHKNLLEMNLNSYNALIKEQPEFGRFICRCEKVSEGEVKDVINRNCGAHTIKGVRKRTRAGFGKCQGAFCQLEVLKILAKELHCEMDEINYSDLGTNILVQDSKEGK